MKKWLKHEVSPEFTLALARLQWKMRRFMAILGIIAMLGSLLPNIQQTYAYTLPEESTREVSSTPVEYPTTTDEDFGISNVALLGEVESLRTESTKTFQRVDGSFVVAMYSDAVHYQKSGKWEDIDNSLSFDTDDDTYNNLENQFQVKFPKSLEENKAIKLTMDDYEISWSILGISKTSIDVSDSAVKTNNMKELTGINQEVTYANVMNGVDVQYILTGTKVKENIILDHFISDFSMSFDYDTKNLSLVEQDGDYLFVNESGDVIFNLSDLFAIDVNGDVTNKLTMQVTEVKKGEYTITISIDQNWLQSAAYPVTIDPTITTANGTLSIQDTYVVENSVTDYSNFSTMVVSNTSSTTRYKSLIGFQLPQSLVGKVVTYAYLSLTASTKTNNRTIGVYENNSSFDASTVTWSTAPTYDSQMIDYVITNSTDSVHRFDVTSSVQDWHQYDQVLDVGFTIKDKNDYGAINAVWATERGTPYAPVLEIGYIDPNGIKDYWTYNSQDAGPAGTGYVSDLTGNLTWVRQDISFSTSKQSLGFSMVYNSYQRSTNIGYGLGWQTNYNMIAGYDSSIGLYYSVDATGSKEYYHSYAEGSKILSSLIPDGSTGSYYLAEDGSGRILLIIENSSSVVTGYYILTTDYTIYAFETLSNLIWYLTSIVDITSESILTITISRNASNPNRIEQITDSSGNKIVITYSSNRIYSAILYVMQDDESFVTTEKTIYSYTYIAGLSDFAPNYVYYYKNMDGNTTWTLDKYVNYSYDSYARMLQAYQSGASKVVYTYDTTKNRVSTISSYYSSSLFQTLTYTYSFRFTTITNQDGDFVTNKFDDYGHTVNIIDKYGVTQTYTYLNLFKNVGENNEITTLLDGTPNYNNNHKLVVQSDAQTTSINPLINPGLEYDLASSDDGWALIKDYLVYSSASRTQTYSQVGDYSIVLGTGLGARAHLEQTVTLDAGSYTLTGYVKNMATPSGNVYIDVTGEYCANDITYVSSDGVWTRVELLFVVEDDDTEITVNLVNNASGAVYFDGIQIMEGFSTNRTNIVENSSFEYLDYLGAQLIGWALSDSYVQRSTLVFDNNIYSDILDDYGIKIIGSGSVNRYAVSDLVNFIDFGQANGMLQIGAWGKSEGSATSLSSDDSADKFFRIRVETTDIYSNSESYYINFDPSIRGWQYSYGLVDISAEITSVELYLEYQGEGTVYFDAIEANYEGSYSNYEYDAYGRISKITQPNGTYYSYTYPPLDHFTRTPETISKNGEEISSIDAENGLINSVTFNNTTGTPDYNTYGEQTSLTVGDSSTHFTTSTTYLSSGFSQYVSSNTDSFGNHTYYYYDVMNGLIKAIENAKGQTTHYIYDDEGKLIEVDSVTGSGTYTANDIDAYVVYGYDAYDRLTKIYFDYDNRPTIYYEITYDPQTGRMSSVKVNSTVLMSYTYDDDTYYSSNLETQTYGNGDSIHFIYNEKNQVSDIMFKDSQESEYLLKYSYIYDSLGQLTVYSSYDESQTLLEQEFYSYDINGKLTKITDMQGNMIQYAYDNDGNVTSVNYDILDQIAFEESFSYNKFLDFGEYSDYTTNSILYDQTVIKQNGTTVATKAYNYEETALYRLDNVLTTIGSFTINQDISYYQSTTRIDEISYTLYNGSSVTLTYSYLYDELGNITKIQYYEGTTLKEQDDYVYDELNQLVSESIYRSDDPDNCVESDVCFTQTYEYDSRGNIESSTRTFNQDLPFVFYDDYSTANVMVGYNSSQYYDFYHLDLYQTPSLTFYYYNPDTLSLFSNVTTTLVSSNLNTSVEGYYYRVYHARNIVLGIDIFFRIYFEVGTVDPYKTITYDYSESWLDQLESYEVEQGASSLLHEITYDNQGNPTTITNVVYDGTTYNSAALSWDGRQLVSITLIGSYGPVYQLAFRYNDQGYRTSKSLYQWISNNWVLQDESTYKLVGDKVVFESDGTYGILYLYDHDGSLISFNYDSDLSDQTDGLNYYYVLDQQGDITKVVDSSGNIVASYQYDAYGNITYQTGSMASINPYTYRGYRYDSGLSWYYLNSRYYVPEIGRFLNSDGLLGQQGDILSTNMYAYCANNPVMGYDPLGMWDWGLFWKITATVAIVSACIALAAVTGGMAAVGIVAITTAVSAVDGGISSSASEGEFWDGFMAGAIGGSVGGLISTFGGPGASIVSRAVNSAIYDLGNEFFQTGTVNSDNLGLYFVDVSMDVALSMVYVGGCSNIANNLYGTAINGFVDGIVDVSQTYLYFSPSAQQRIKNKFYFDMIPVR